MDQDGMPLLILEGRARIKVRDRTRARPKIRDRLRIKLLSRIRARPKIRDRLRIKLLSRIRAKPKIRDRIRPRIQPPRQHRLRWWQRRGLL